MANSYLYVFCKFINYYCGGGYDWLKPVYVWRGFITENPGGQWSPIRELMSDTA